MVPIFSFRLKKKTKPIAISTERCSRIITRFIWMLCITSWTISMSQHTLSQENGIMKEMLFITFLMNIHLPLILFSYSTEDMKDTLLWLILPVKDSFFFIRAKDWNTGGILKGIPRPDEEEFDFIYDKIFVNKILSEHRIALSYITEYIPLLHHIFK